MIAITTYYNPCHYKTRLENFKLFRKQLNIPLIAIELSFDGNFELDINDADYLVKIQSDTVIWQKERLLNIALTHIPSCFKYVAWLDCDVIFADEMWANEAIQLLQSFELVQLFSAFIDLPKDVVPNRDNTIQLTTTGHSISFLKHNNHDSIDNFRPLSSVQLRKAAFGLAWASKVDFIKKYGFYDAMIIGSGDRAMACAAFGQFADLIHTGRMNKERELHYLKWAYPFFEAVNGKVGNLKTPLYHLWHGDISNRYYVERHQAFSEFDFNPFVDLTIDSNGCWVLNDKSKTMTNFFLNYFKSRREDGVELV